MTLFDIEDNEALDFISDLIHEGWRVTAVSFVRGYRRVRDGYSVSYGFNRKGYPTCAVNIPNRHTSVKSCRYGAVVRLVDPNVDLPF